jgi:uncharacterized membrane protein YjdF
VEQLIWHTFRWGLSLALGGLLILVVVIPIVGKLKTFTSVRTEFFSARAAYWCVLAGLGIVMTISIGLAVRLAIVGLPGGK